MSITTQKNSFGLRSIRLLLAMLLACSGMLLPLTRSACGQNAEQESADAPVLLTPRQIISQLRSSGGLWRIPAGTYRLDETLELDLTELGAVSVLADGPVTLQMHGPGPALRIVGDLSGSADPDQIAPATWQQRMPRVEGIEILGFHPQAGGIELVRTMQAIIDKVAIRHVHHAIRLTERNRNVLLGQLHLYDNSGIGLFLDRVNLHQINVASSHISYNRLGGIVVRGGNVRNLHVTGCDLEANMPENGTRTEAANILIDQSEAEGSVAEVAITGCTIQHSAHYGPTHRAPGGANIRILGRPDTPPNMITITGNLLSDTATHLHLRHVTDTTVTGNTFFTTEPIDVLLEHCQRVVVADCIFNPREVRGTGQLILRDCEECLLSGLILRDLVAGESAILLQRCRHTPVQSCVISGAKNGVWRTASEDCPVQQCTVRRLAPEGRKVVDGPLPEQPVPAAAEDPE